MDFKEQLKKADLLIVDADNTVAPHLTAGLANKIAKYHIIKLIDKKVKFFRENKIITTRKAIKDILKYILTFRINPSLNIKDYLISMRLMIFGLLLHITKFIFTLFGVEDNSFLISLYKKTLRGIDIRPFLFNKKELENSLFPYAKELIRKVKCKKVMISQSFKCKGKMIEHYKPILGLNEVISNELILDKNGKIKKFEIKITGSSSKVKFAEKFKALNIVIMGNDCADLGLAELPNSKIVIARKPPYKLRRISDFVVKDSYKDLVKKS